MKTLACLSFLFLSFTARATTPVCQPLVLKTVEALDKSIVQLEGPFQGDEADNDFSIELAESSVEGNLTYEIFRATSFHNNDEGDSWNYIFEVKTYRNKTYCYGLTGFSYLGVETLTSSD